METRTLLVDFLPFEINPQQIRESLEKNNGRIIVSGILQRADTRNQNGRIYPKEVLQREAKKYVGTNIKEHRALGELDHPDSEVVNLQNTSHNILEMHWSNDDLVGTIEILGTPSGNILKELLKAGIKLGISSRGLGTVKEIKEDDGNDTVEVQPDFDLIAFDFVSNPSTQGAFMGPLNENVKSHSGRTCGKWCRVESIINDIMRGQ
jgi:hypothetical protein|tara:strand:+ start:53 stop:673 length:621 start_codon:yes stop_codon:yes gene_type:complete